MPKFFDTKEINQRLKRAIDMSGNSIRSIEKAVNTGNGTISRALKHDKDIGHTTLSKIIYELNINTEWLFRDIGEIFIENSNFLQEPKPIYVNQENVNYLIDLLRNKEQIIKDLEKTIQELNKKSA